MKIYAARHAEATWNAQRRIIGTLPGELSEEGHEQAMVLGAIVSRLKLTDAYGSDLRRVRQTVEGVRKVVPGLAVQFTEQLRERDFGELQGKLMSEVDWEGFWAVPDEISLYGAESIVDCTRRVATFLLDLREADPDSRIGLFTHAAIMNRMHYLENPARFKSLDIDYADVVEFDTASMMQHAADLLGE